MNTAARRQPRRERGFALIAALFLVIVVALLGIMAVRIGISQQHATNVQLLTARATAAATSGLEYGLARAALGKCAATPLSLSGFSVQVKCVGSVYVVDAVPYSVFRITATASFGAYGTAQFVQRRVERTLSTLP